MPTVRQRLKLFYLSAVGPRCRPWIDRIYYRSIERDVARHPSQSPSCRLPFPAELPYRTLVSPAYSHGILSASPSLAHLLGTQYINIYFPVEIIGRQPYACPFLVHAPTPVHLAELGYLQATNLVSLCRRSKTKELYAALTEKLADGWYCLVNANDRYVIKKRADYRHATLVHGWDREANQFLVSRYITDGNLESFSVRAADLLKGIVSRGRFDLSVPYYATPPGAMCLKENPAQAFRYSREAIVTQLDDYLASRGPKGNYLDFLAIAGRPAPEVWMPPDQAVYGAATFPLFTTYLQRQLADGLRLDLRVTRCFFEHKEMMQSRFRYVAAQGVKVSDPKALDAYGELVKWAKLLHFVAFGVGAGAAPKDELLSLTEDGPRMEAIEQKALRTLREALGPSSGA